MTIKISNTLIVTSGLTVGQLIIVAMPPMLKL